MSNWHWLLLGFGAGYLVARSGGSAGLGFSFNTGVSGAPSRTGFIADGAGDTPLDEPRGSNPYQTIGVWDPQIPGSFPDYPSPRDAVLGVNGGALQ
jgi:hypothetical protein